MQSCCSRRASTAVLLAIALTLALLPSVGALADRDAVCADTPAGAFVDVPTTNLHRANIDCVAATGIARGVGGAAYDPASPVLRGQMASYLVNLLEVAGGAPLEAPAGPAPFADGRGTTHDLNIRIAAHLRITSGRTPTAYEPHGEVTRAQMATFVAKAIEAAGALLPDSPPDAFGDDDGSVHEPSIDAIAAADMVRGVGVGRYDPDEPVTRAQMATYLVNAAAFLHRQGLWSAAADDGAPSLLLVLRGADDRDDLLELRFDRTVEVGAAAGSVTVHDEAGEVLLARASLLPDADQPGGNRVLLRTDADLTTGMVHRLRIAEGVVQAPDGTPNEALERVFAFTAAVVEAPDGDDAGGDGTSDGTNDGTSDGTTDGTNDGTGDGATDAGDGATAVAPAILSVVTAPPDDLIVVTFTESVTCPSSAAARTAWSFTNQSVIESGGTQASGAPLEVVDLGTARPEACGLRYDDIENGDFGTLSYTQPAGADDQVRNAEGAAVESVTGVEVRDGEAPLMTSITASAGPPTVVRMLFTEPVLCSSLSAGDLEVVINGLPVLGAIQGFGCFVVSDNPTVQLVDGAFSEGDAVQIVVLGEITSQSGYQSVAEGTTRFATATG